MTIALISASIRTQLRRFRGDDRGSIAIIFGLSTMVVFLAAGLAIDLGRANLTESQIGAAIDSAALAGVKGLRLQNLSDAETVQLAKTMFNVNLTSTGGDASIVKSVTVTIDRKNSSVKIDVDARLPASFGKLAGIDTFNLARSGAAKFDAKDFEVALQLDVTGSMGGSKIADLKTATKELVDILIPDEPTGQTVRIGYAPFAAGVNAGSLASSVAGGSAPGSCVYERYTSSYQTSDAAPTGSARLTTTYDTGPAQPCPSAKVLPLTDSKSTLKSTVDGYYASGSTAGHLGTAWSWYLISPEWAGILPNASRPAAYGDKSTVKVSILMTDGEYNTFAGKNTSANIVKSSDFAKSTCSAMKARGIIVYTVGFKLTDATAKDVLGNCASSSTKSFLAEDGDALRQAFKAIANDIVTLRLTQ